MQKVVKMSKTIRTFKCFCLKMFCALKLLLKQCHNIWWFYAFRACKHVYEGGLELSSIELKKLISRNSKILVLKHAVLLVPSVRIFFCSLVFINKSSIE